MVYISRLIEGALTRALARGKSVLLLGPRQTGKTTLVCRQPHQLHIDFITPPIRQRYERNPSILSGEARFNPIIKYLKTVSSLNVSIL